MDRNNLIKKSLVVAVILLFIGMSINPLTVALRDFKQVTEINGNSPPSTPIFLGPIEGFVDGAYFYTINSTDPDGDEIHYEVNWDDGTTQGSINLSSGTEIEWNHTWYEKGTYTLKAKARDIHGADSDWAIIELQIYDTIYVDDDNTAGPWNGTIEHPYHHIQDGIDAADSIDTVFVFNGTYYENIVVDKSINLIGENKDTTIIDGINDVDVVNITADGVTVSGFTVQKIENDSKIRINLIFIQSNYNVISENIITGNTHCGIYIFISEYSIISGNTISSVYKGIGLWRGENNNISGNIIKDCTDGIELIWYSNNNSIFGNTLTNNSWGISTMSINDVISLNNISYNFYGISIINCFNYKITRNNFIGNNWSALFSYSLFFAYQFGLTLKDIHSTIKWDGNYWDRPRIFPKPILGWLTLGSIPWFQFDWHPAREPYDIPMGV